MKPICLVPIAFSIVVLTYSTKVHAEIPTLLFSKAGRSAKVPDFHRLTFENLPKLTQPGIVGDRFWVAGTPLVDLLTLGDLHPDFRTGDLNLIGIFRPLRIKQERVTLDNFPLINRQPFSVLSEFPGLGDLPVKRIAPLRDRLSLVFPRPNMDLSLKELVKRDKMLGTVDFAGFDVSRYRISDLPGLTLVPFRHFKHWDTTKLSDIPGLAKLPWERLPAPPVVPGSGEIADFHILKRLTDEDSKDSVISGSAETNFHSPCIDNSCSAFRLTGIRDGNSRIWIDTSQWVGQNNLEPAGRSIFTNAFKVGVHTKAMTSSIFFRFCNVLPNHEFNCSPYLVGPLSFMAYKPKDPIFVGVVPPIEFDATPPPAETQASPLPLREPQPKVVHNLPRWLEQTLRWIPLLGRYIWQV